MTPTPDFTRRSILAAGAAIATAPLVSARFTSALAKAPMLGISQPAVYRFKLGDFEITMISDSDAFIDGPHPIIGANASPDEVAALMRDNLLPANRYQPGFTPMLINTGSAIVLFDTGNGANGFVPRPYGGWLAAKLASAGFEPDQIDLVVLTHGHGDHVGGLMENGKPLFPNASYAIGAIDYDFWANEGRLPEELRKLAAPFRANVLPLAARTRMLKPGEEVVPGIRAIEAHGHTPGHLTFHIESGGKRLLAWGDCAHHQVASLARPDWHCSFDVDKEQGAATRKRIYDMAATERIAVSGYHMPFPSLGYVERLSGGGYRWLAHSYQLNL